MFRALNKDLRKLLPSNREVTGHFIDIWRGYAPRCSLTEALLDFLDTEYGLQTGDHAIERERIPAHLSMRYEVIDENRQVLGSGKNLGALQERFAVDVQARFAEVKEEVRFEKNNLRRWSIGDLPERIELDRHTTGFPGLHASAALKLWPSADCAAQQHRLGVAALYAIAEPDRVAQLERVLFHSGGSRGKVPVAAKQRPRSIKPADSFNSLAAAFGGLQSRSEESPQKGVSPVGREAVAGSCHDLSASELLLLAQLGPEPRRNRADLVTRILAETLGAPRTEADWGVAIRDAGSGLGDTAAELCAKLTKILGVAESIALHLGERRPGYGESLDDARQHFEQLLMPGWLLHFEPDTQLRNLRGLELRLTRMFGSPPAKDLAKLERYQSAAAGVWAEPAECECGECEHPGSYLAQLSADEDLRLKEFAPELRR